MPNTHSGPRWSLPSQAMTLSFSTPSTATRPLNPRSKPGYQCLNSCMCSSLLSFLHHPKALYFPQMGTLFPCSPRLCGRVGTWSEAHGIQKTLLLTRKASLLSGIQAWDYKCYWFNECGVTKQLAKYIRNTFRSINLVMLHWLSSFGTGFPTFSLYFHYYDSKWIYGISFFNSFIHLHRKKMGGQ